MPDPWLRQGRHHDEEFHQHWVLRGTGGMAADSKGMGGIPDGGGLGCCSRSSPDAASQGLLLWIPAFEVALCLPSVQNPVTMASPMLTAAFLGTGV